LETGFGISKSRNVGPHATFEKTATFERRRRFEKTGDVLKGCGFQPHRKIHFLNRALAPEVQICKNTSLFNLFRLASS